MMSLEAGVLGIFEATSGRTQLVNDVEIWAKSRGINTVHLDDTTINDSEDLIAAYVPILRDYTIPNKIPSSIPLIVDFDNGAATPGPGAKIRQKQLGVLCQQRRRLAIRLFSLAGGVPSQPNLIAPYCHLPINIVPKAERDVVLIDHHGWENHDQVLKLLLNIEQDEELKFYYNYPQLLLRLKDIIPGKCQFIEHTIPYIDDLNTYLKLFVRTKYYVSIQNWLSDLNTFNAYVSGAMILPKFKKYYHPMSKALLYIEPQLEEEFERLQQPCDVIRDDVPVELYRKAYFGIWDRLWEWACTGKVDKTLSELSVGVRQS